LCCGVLHVRKRSAMRGACDVVFEKVCAALDDL